ncbi:hypothetical protein GCM10020331_045250 [Ectobacillus funiculus]
MIQRFIELGEGYSDLYELLEIAKANRHRLAHMLAFHTTKKIIRLFAHSLLCCTQQQKENSSQFTSAERAFPS